MKQDVCRETSGFAESELIACIPHLRAFALFRTRNRDQADDLVQDTIVRALGASQLFRAGSNLKAWLCTILRNQHCNILRKNAQMRIQSIDDPMQRQPAVAATQEASLEYADFCRAFWQLTIDQREVLILIGPSGLSYVDAAKVCGCAIGTIKSRTSRARRELLKILENGLSRGARGYTPPLSNCIADWMSNPRASAPLAPMAT
jgi:RNA polymerase sigma-70 factor (ECF subfamily)